MPPEPNDRLAKFTLPDGTSGLLRAARGATASADNYAGTVIETWSSLCKGNFASGKQVVPSTNGSVIRKVKTACDDGAKSYALMTTIIRHPNGLLIELNHSEPMNALTADGESRQQDRASIVDAAVRVTGDWK